ncbi:winged helix DNA-binding domain-containing protein [Streptacidiphilus jiangxiensis]|uniref:Winged helix DNA-binding domain-containing protein n=1 Tax=Streptacidiphilus jiangxiensis TaxID=235985 RepID=A0A1H7RN12_STRJI|nr:winged helix DNA-binding domain-containing protein [Streptacidiphilus jiangxiensis]SEL61700.1 Winged helix DNA-binding domain-containing protein [Streptacidiphilus jiangxiensis]
MAASKLDDRRLNRALMARQFLLAREDAAPLSVVNHLVGLQSQIPQNPYTALWSRITGFDPAEASALLAERETVRLSTLRGTIHLHDVEDALLLRAFCQGVHEATAFGERVVFRKQLAGIEPEALYEAGRDLLAAAPMTPAALGKALAEAFPGYEPTALATAVRYKLSLVQVTPRGEWGRSQAATLTTVEAWLGRPQRRPDAAAVEALTLRYLAAFGPASVQDMQSWCGVTRLGEVFERLRPRLAVFADATTGRELFDLPEAPRPDPGTPAPPRFLPDYDNVLIGHDNRARVLDEQARGWLGANNNGYRPALLVDGRVAGVWSFGKPKRKGAPAVLEVELFGPQRAAARREIEAEAADLLDFLAPKSAERDLRLH